jgi:hypothetical protein
MRTRKLIVVTVLLLAMVAAGVALLDFWKKKSTEERLAQSVKQSEFAYQQYRGADYATAKKAILAHLEHLNKLSAESERPARNPYASDAMMWYVRLAHLEEMNNNLGGKSEYMSEALSRCAKIGQWDCSEETLLREAERMDALAAR